MIPQGYKQTEVGVIPEEWGIKYLDDFEPFITSGSRGWAAHYSKSGALFVRITNMSRESIYLDLADSKYVTIPSESSEGIRTQLREHDVLISITADIGIVGYVDAQTRSPAYINQHIALARFDPETVSGRFLSYFLASSGPQKNFRALTDAGAKAGMSLSTVKRLLVAVPVLLEQRAIAEALSDVDALLGELDRLIAKKRDLKQAAMQQLLTGQTRLPGFTGEWEMKRLGDLFAALEAGVSVNSTDEEGSDFSANSCILKTSSVAGGRFFPQQCKRVVGADLNRVRLNPRRDTILISRMNTPDLVGECGYVGDDYPNLFVPDRLWMTRFRSETVACARYLAFLLSAPDQRRQIGSAATGTSGSMKNLAKSAFLALEIRLPPFLEQSAIASVLSEMDAELAALEQCRCKTRALKQAMMQELLTGKTRLL